jgi:hypothetical protein
MNRRGDEAGDEEGDEGIGESRLGKGGVNGDEKGEEKTILLYP